jgi:hypothetical protein
MPSNSVGRRRESVTVEQEDSLMTTENNMNPFDTMQRIAAASWPRMGDAAAQQIHAFWKNQEKILESFQELSQSWFEHRRKATQSAVEAARGLGDAKSPVDLFKGWQTWATGSADRLMADTFACQKHLINVTEAVASQIPPEAAQMKSEVMSTISAMRDAKSHAEAA